MLYSRRPGINLPIFEVSRSGEIPVMKKDRRTPIAFFATHRRASDFESSDHDKGM